MFLIDTNVISESRKVRSGRAAPAVVAWLKATDPSTTFVSAMSLFELELGVVRVERRDPHKASGYGTGSTISSNPALPVVCWRWTRQSRSLALRCTFPIR